MKRQSDGRVKEREREVEIDRVKTHSILFYYNIKYLTTIIIVN